jgi:hypothetical protein
VLGQQVCGITWRNAALRRGITWSIQSELDQDGSLGDGGLDRFEGDGMRLRAKLGAAGADLGFKLIQLFLKPPELRLIGGGVTCPRPSERQRGKLRTRSGEPTEQFLILCGGVTA